MYDDDRAAGTRTEALGLWTDNESAAEAVEDWIDEVALCGARGARSHSGYLIEWTVADTDLEGTDGLWAAYQRNLEPDLARDEVVDSFYVVARVGNAVYVEGVLVRGGLDQDSITAHTRAGKRSIAAYLPSLLIFDDNPSAANEQP